MELIASCDQCDLFYVGGSLFKKEIHGLRSNRIFKYENAVWTFFCSIPADDTTSTTRLLEYFPGSQELIYFRNKFPLSSVMIYSNFTKETRELLKTSSNFYISKFRKNDDFIEMAYGDHDRIVRITKDETLTENLRPHSRIYYVDFESSCYQNDGTFYFKTPQFSTSVIEGAIPAVPEYREPLINENLFYFLGKWRESFVFYDGAIKTINSNGVFKHFVGMIEFHYHPNLQYDNGKILFWGDQTYILNLDNNYVLKIENNENIYIVRDYTNNHFIATSLDDNQTKLFYRINTLEEEEEMLEQIPRTFENLDPNNPEHLSQIVANIALENTRLIRRRKELE